MSEPTQPPQSAGDPGIAKLDVPRLNAITAAQQVALSRERLLEAMRARNRPAAAPTGTHGLQRWTLPWLTRLRSMPVIDILIGFASRWWARHPLRVAGLVAGDGATAAVQRLSVRHPIAMVVGALALGAVLVWSRPWRWILKPALIAKLLPKFLTRALRAVPSGSWLALLAALTQARRKRTSSGPGQTLSTQHPPS